MLHFPLLIAQLINAPLMHRASIWMQKKASNQKLSTLGQCVNTANWGKNTVTHTQPYITLVCTRLCKIIPFIMLSQSHGQAGHGVFSELILPVVG